MENTANVFTQINKLGQSLWLDYIDRHLITSGTLEDLVKTDRVKGVTSNPAIFEKAIRTDSSYANDIRRLASEHLPVEEIFEHLAIADIRAAADILRPVYDASQHRDGFVSLEVSPLLAYDSTRTITEARRLWQSVSRRNLMIKVPATEQGLSAIRTLIAEGIHVNVTLLFSRHMYARVVEAWLAGLEQWAAQGGNPGEVSSVASFFISRIDTAVDAQLQERLALESSASGRTRLQHLLGKTAIANARLAYAHFLALMDSDRWRRLAQLGAQPQRLLWASTGTKSPDYSDILYVENLIGPDTVNTLPPATLQAFGDHGKALNSLENGIAEAGTQLEMLDQLNISLESLTEKLLVDGVTLFATAYHSLLAEIAKHAPGTSAPHSSTRMTS